jgi:NhaA family Na+:H+ antiporter
MAKRSHAAPRTPQPIDRIVRPFQEFADTAASGGLVLLAAALTALAWANSPFAHSYHDLWHTAFSIGIGEFVVSQPLEVWINDGLMAVFFFVVGLEIKREVLTGELSTFRQASLPVAAAVGGMIVPALIYASWNYGTPEISGWGIPMATDIAFALGVLALLGKRVPVSLRVFLTASAIVDDLGAVLVIAIFYTAQISGLALAAGLAGLAVMALANRLGVRSTLAYLLIGLGVWAAFLASGVHATIAGVLTAMTIPARSVLDEDKFVAAGRDFLDAIDDDDAVQERKFAVVHALETSCEHVQTPLLRLEHALHPWVAFVIMPIFALANAGIPLGTDFVESLAAPVTIGVAVGLIIGKQIGVTLFTWLAVRSGLAVLPATMSWRSVSGLAWLAGIGFTMSIFIAGLAFDSADTLLEAKAGILGASLIAGVTGYLLLRRALPQDSSASAS